MQSSSTAASPHQALLVPELAGDRSFVLHRFADEIAAAQGFDAEKVFDALWEREQLAPTAIGSRIALPHCRLKAARAVHLAVGVAEEGVEFNAPDGEPVTLFFVLVSPTSSNASHLKALQTLSRWIQDNDLQALAKKPSVAALEQALASLAIG